MAGGYSTSSTTSSDDPEPVRLRVQGDSAYAHLNFARGHVVDAISGECVTEKTKLVTLYEPATNSLVKRMACLGSPGFKCQIIVDGLKRLPPEGSATYRISVTFKDLVSTLMEVGDM